MTRFANVQVTLNIRVNRENWDTEYGTDVDIYEDVREYVTNAIWESAAKKAGCIFQIDSAVQIGDNSKWEKF